MGKPQKSMDILTIIEEVMKIPIVKVDRTSFLTAKFIKLATPEQMEQIIKDGPYKAGVKRKVIDNLAKSIIQKNTLSSTSVSFVAGLPGGFAMAATIPADVLQFFAVSLRLAQELAYLYGHDDLRLEEHHDTEAARDIMLVYLGVMLGVSGSASAIKFLSSGLSKAILKKLPQKALTKTLYYPIIKKVAGYIGIKLTKDSFAKSVSKVVPILGGIVSGTITYATMRPMGKKLAATLSESLELTRDDVIFEYGEMKKNFPDIVDIDFEEIS